MDFGVPHSADTAPWPEYFSAGSSARASASASSAARTSIHSRAGRRCWPSFVVATTVALVASTEMPAMASAGTLDFSSATRTDATTASHQVSGSCSARPGRGKDVFHSVEPRPLRPPAASKMAARAPPVPMSMPSRNWSVSHRELPCSRGCAHCGSPGGDRCALSNRLTARRASAQPSSLGCSDVQRDAGEVCAFSRRGASVTSAQPAVPPPLPHTSRPRVVSRRHGIGRCPRASTRGLVEEMKRRAQVSPRGVTTRTGHARERWGAPPPTSRPRVVSRSHRISQCPRAPTRGLVEKVKRRAHDSPRGRRHARGASTRAGSPRATARAGLSP